MIRSVTLAALLCAACFLACAQLRALAAPATTPTPAASPSWHQRIVGGAAIRVESLLVLVVLCAVMAALSSAFLSVSNVLNILLSTSVFGVLAIGMTFVISSAGIDLSVGSLMAIAGAVAAMLVGL